jgi:hypothetical protein
MELPRHSRLVFFYCRTSLKQLPRQHTLHRYRLDLFSDTFVSSVTSRKTERGAIVSGGISEVRAAPFALLRSFQR